MKVEIKKLDKLKRVIKVDIEGETFLKEKENIYKELSKNLKVPGFRPGSAPLEILEKYHSKTLKEEFLKRALPLYYQQALEANKLMPAGLPRIYDVDLDKKSLSFSAELDVRPELELEASDYKGITIKDKKIEVGEQEIEKVLTNLKEGVKKVVSKDLTDEVLARWAGYPSVARLREAIKAEIFVEKLRQRRLGIDNQISQHLPKRLKVDVPKSEVEQHHKDLVNQEIYNLRINGVPEKDIDKYKKDIEEKIKPLAEEQVRLSYIINAIAKKEGIEAEKNLGEVVLGFILSCAQYQE